MKEIGTTGGLLNKRSMAASLGISVQAFTKWGVKPVKKVGREYLYCVRDVLDNCLERDRRRLQRKMK